MKKKLLIEGYFPRRHFEAHVPSIAAFRKAHPTAHIEAVNDRGVRAMCESCSSPIYADQKYNWDDEGVYWHKRCQRATKKDAT